MKGWIDMTEELLLASALSAGWCWFLLITTGALVTVLFALFLWATTSRSKHIQSSK